MTDPTAAAPVPDLFCTTIVPTLGRQTIHAALVTLLDTDAGADREVIVVNDSGAPLVEASWHADARVRIVDSPRPRGGQGRARNHAATLARGRYLHFHDDDDATLPGAFAHLRAAAAAHPEAGWLYGESVRVDAEGRPLDRVAQRRSGNVFALALAGDWFPLGATLVRADAFRRAGGFDTSVRTSEDSYLTLRLALQEEMAYVPHLLHEYLFAPSQSHGTRDLDAHNFFGFQERLLADPRALGRARRSARTSYERGAVARVYLLSAKRNFREGQRARALLRAAQATTLLASPLDRRFLEGVRRPYRGEWYV